MIAIPDVEAPLSKQVPEKVISSLRKYAEKRLPVGGFLTAVLSNDLCTAVNKADSKNLLALPAIVRYVYWNLPSRCWGSREKVRKWLKETQ